MASAPEKLEDLIWRYCLSSEGSIDTVETVQLLGDISIMLMKLINWAAFRNQPNVITTVLSSLGNNLSYGLLTKVNWKPLYDAAMNGHGECIGAILTILTPRQRLELLSREIGDRTLSDWALFQKQEETDRLLRDYKQESIIAISGCVEDLLELYSSNIVSAAALQGLGDLIEDLTDDEKITLFSKRLFSIALDRAAMNGNADIITTILSSLPGPQRLDLLLKASWTPLHYAVVKGHLNCIEAILEHLDPTQQLQLMSWKCCFFTAVEWAVKTGKLSAEKMLRDYDACIQHQISSPSDTDIDEYDLSRPSRSAEMLAKPHQLGETVMEYLNSKGLTEIMEDIAAICCRNEPNSPLGPVVNFGEDHDKIYDKLWSHSEGHGAETAVSCILVSYKVESRAPEDILILAKGDVPVVSDYSRSGENFTWRISRLKLWSKPLIDLIQLQQSTTPNIQCFEQCPLHMVFKLKNSSKELEAITQITPSVEGDTIEYHNGQMIMRLAQPPTGEGITAVFKLLVDFDQVDQFTGIFEEMKAESSHSDGSEASIFIDELDMEEDINIVTIIEILANTETQVTESLYYIVAGNLPNLSEKESAATQPVTMRAHYINNDMLHEQITEKFESEESLQGIPEGKREKIKQTGPPFVVVSALPMIRSDGSGECEIRNILPAVGSEPIEGDDIEQYVYRHGSALVFRLNEPQSPMSFTVGCLTYSVEPQEPSKMWTDDLDSEQLKLFNILRESHNQQGTVHSKDAVTAITVVAIHGEKKRNMSTHVYFVPALVYGNSVTDMNTCTPYGWRVTSLHLYNKDLRAMVESKCLPNSRKLPCTVFQGSELRRIARDDICAYDYDCCQEKILIEADITLPKNKKGCRRDEVSRRYLKLSYRGVSKDVATFFEVLNSEFDGSEVKKLQCGLTKHGDLFTDTTYLKALQQPDANDNRNRSSIGASSIPEKLTKSFPYALELKNDNQGRSNTHASFTPKRSYSDHDKYGDKDSEPVLKMKKFDGDIKMLQSGVEKHENLFKDTTYRRPLEQPNTKEEVAGCSEIGDSGGQSSVGASRTANSTGGDDDKVMISVHLLKSKLRVDSRKEGKRKRKVIELRKRKELKSDLVIIVAAGNEENLHVPRSFSYHDPLNAWYSQTEFITSKPLRMAIERHWAGIPTTMDSVAHYLAFFCEDEGRKPKLLDTCKAKAKVERELIEIMAHGPEDKPLCHVLGKNVKDCIITSDNRDPFPEDGNLPNSFMYAVAKLKHMILPRPNQLGVSSTDGLGALFLLFHDAAHNKFALPNAEPRKKTDHHLNNHQSGSSDIVCLTCKKSGITLNDKKRP